MKRRLILSSIWLIAFGLGLLAVESYIVFSFHSYRVLLPEDRFSCMRPLIVLYGSYLTGILAFWFIKPVRRGISSRSDNARFVVALACTLLFNGVVLYFVLRPWWSMSEEQSVLSNIRNGAAIGGWLSFLVAPVNLYYFGARGLQDGNK